MNMDNIRNKTAVITGGASGLGFTFAQMLLQNGAKAVALLSLDSNVGPASAAALEKEFGKGKAVFFPCDVSNYQEFAAVFKKAFNSLNGVDILINNAGILNDRKWEKTISVNVGGVVQGSLLAMDYMGKHKGGKGGTLVNIASIVALTPLAVCPVYSASKHDVLAFSRCLQEHYPKTGVRVLVICPGVTTTALFDEMKEGTLDFIASADIERVFGALPTQPPENVGQAMMKLIQKGTNGSVWVSEANQPPYAVEFPPCTKVQLNL